jgi:tetratricopeptide (TPR) repeat protein
VNTAKTCYVSIPFGRKHDLASGRGVDYDRVFHDLIVPAAERAGLVCTRADQFAGTLIVKEITRAVITADVMIADVSGGDANVMYELGLRHALRRGSTVLVTSTPLPFNVSYGFALHYEVGSDGAPAAESGDAFRSQLAQVLAEKAQRLSTDSPVFEYFPELQVVFPADLEAPDVRRRSYPPEVQAVRGPDRKAAVARAEQATRSASDVDPQAYLDLLRRYRDLGAWEDIVRLGSELPLEVAELPQVVQAVALAYSRLGDVHRAITLLAGLVERTGGDAESHALLGSLFKKQHFLHHSEGSLAAALHHYRKGFEANPYDLYVGRNLAQLLHRVGGASERQELRDLLPRLRRLADERLSGPAPDFWMLDSALVLALLDGDAGASDELCRQMVDLRPEAWMLESARMELSGVLERAVDEAERSLVQLATERLEARAEDEVEEADDAQF